MSIVRIVRFREHGGFVRWGVVRDDYVHIVEGAFSTTGDLLTVGREAIRAACQAVRGDRRPLGSVLAPDALLSPITNRQQVICQAVNYRGHAIEAGFGPEGLGANVFFRKASSCLTSATEPVVRPRGVHLLDYELELALVVGARIDGPRDVSWDNLHEFVAGVVMFDDLSARDVQVPEGQFFKGKSYRGFGPTGPYLCLLDAASIGRIPELELQLAVDGDVRQSGRFSEVIYDAPSTVAELSGVMDLDPGDLIATGTPSGVALRAPNKAVAGLAQLLPRRSRWALFTRSQARSGRYLEPGQTIDAWIRTPDRALDLGTMRTRVVHPTDPSAA